MNSFDTEENIIQIGKYKIHINKIKNIDELYDELLSKGDDHEDVKDERIPYWADLWPSAIGLGFYLVNNYQDLNNIKVLEIGCGLGLSGIVAGLLGADVTMSDYLQEPLEMASSNWKLNLTSEPQVKQFDWRYPDPLYTSDIILATDVLYEKRSHSYLIEFFTKMIKPNGYALLADPGRSASKDFFEQHYDNLTIEKQTTEKVNYNGLETLIHIYKIKKNSTK